MKTNIHMTPTRQFVCQVTGLLLVMFAVIAVVASCLGSAYAQSSAPAPTCTTATIPVCQMGQPLQDVQVKPQAVPTSLTKVAVIDAYLKGCWVYQPAGVTVTIQDNQASPIPFFPAITTSVTTGSLVLFSGASDGTNKLIGYRYWAPNGFSIVASGAGAYFQCSWSQ